MKKYKIDPVLFYPTVILLLVMIGYGFFFNDSFVKVMNFLYDVVTDSTGWFMLIITGLIVILCFVICLTPLGICSVEKNVLQRNVIGMMMYAVYLGISL